MDYLILRLLSSFLSGVLLSQAGSFIQLGTRNILASPSTLGIEGLSVLWILSVHSLLLGMGVGAGWMGLMGVPIFAVIGYLLSRSRGELRMEKILFVGLTFNLLVGAIFSLWQFFFLAFNLPFPMEVWFGNFRYVSSFQAIALLMFELGLVFFLFRAWKSLQLYSLGVQVSRVYSAKLPKLYSFLFIFSFAGTFLVISFFGAFSFLGLLFPLIARKFWFKAFDLKGELVFGALTNGIVLMAFDYLCYSFPVMGAEIPVGLIASVVGALCLIAIVLRGRRAPHFLANARK